MKVSVTTLGLAQLQVDLLALLVPADADALQALPADVDASLERALADFAGDAGQTALVYPDALKAQRVLLVGLGEATDGEALRRGASAVAKRAGEVKADTVGIVVPGFAKAADAGQAIAEGFGLGAYRFDRYKTGDENGHTPKRLVLHAGDGNEAAVRNGAERGRITAEAANFARDLVNLSPDEKTATLLAKQAQEMAKKAGLDVEVWDKERIVAEKMGGLLAVNRGSTEPPSFTILEWKADNARNEKPIVLVGKGVVFDTGGLSLKPTKNSMDHMKADMGGAAAVIGAMDAVARLKMPLHVIALVPATDNRPGENAYVPGDVVRMHSGKTVEVLNTDAEGRMLLADALSYAKRYTPELVIDAATLTGAAVVALGEKVAAVLTSETDGADERITLFEEAGRRSGERVARLPMFADYGDLIKSDVADIKNVGGRAAGTITAAKFLEHFTDYPWVHLDIAGPAFLDSADGYLPKGGTGFGVRLLTEALRQYADQKKG